jgi:hypothetical protein
LAEYANDLLSLGVDGLRLDAAKRESRSRYIFLCKCDRHDVSDIAATDLANITSRFISTPYITQEVIWGPGEPIQPSEYVEIGIFGLHHFGGSCSSSFLTGNVQEYILFLSFSRYLF